MKDALRDLKATALALAGNKRAILVFVATYIMLLAALGLFVLTREATIRDVLISLAMLVAVPVLFFLLQAMCINYEETNEAAELMKRSLRIVGKLIVISIPVILSGVALYLLADRIEMRLVHTSQAQISRALAQEGETWSRVLFSAFRLLLFAVIFPLASIHLWIAVTHSSVRQVIGHIRSVLFKAFAARSIRTYVLGFVIFGILPYILIAVRTPSQHAWLEISLLSARLVLAFGLILAGWVITVGAIHKGLHAEVEA